MKQPEQYNHWYQAAAERWRDIDWTIKGFSEHLATLGDPKGPHGEDIYLAGSAAHRRDGSWEAFTACFQEAVQRFVSRGLGEQGDAVDVWGSLVLKLLDDGSANAERDSDDPDAEEGVFVERASGLFLVQYRGNIALRNAVFAFAHNIVRDKWRRSGTERKHRERLAVDIERTDTTDEDARSEEIAARYGLRAGLAAASGDAPLGVRNRVSDKELRAALQLKSRGMTLEWVVKTLGLQISVSTLSRTLKAYRERIIEDLQENATKI